MSPLRRIAPTLSPPPLEAIVGGFRSLLGSRSSDGELARQIALLYPEARIGFFNSGRAALMQALSAALRATGRRRVVLPAYTSFSVAAAAAAAGATVDLCDVHPLTLDNDRAALRECVSRDTAAVVLGNLFGYPGRTTDLAWLRDAGVLLIDDAAQALGAVESGKPVGLRGDLGVLSFGRGKCVTTGQGGALLVRDPALLGAMNPLAAAPVSRGVCAWLTAVAVAISRNRWAFGILSRLPGLSISESRYDPQFHVAGSPRSTDGLARSLAQIVKRQLDVRRRIARLWCENLQSVENLDYPSEVPDSCPAYLRFPILAPSRVQREAMVKQLANVGFGHVRSFPTCLDAISAFRPFCGDRHATPGADLLAERLIALPCHAGVGVEDARRAARALRLC